MLVTKWISSTTSLRRRDHTRPAHFPSSAVSDASSPYVPCTTARQSGPDAEYRDKLNNNAHIGLETKLLLWK